MKGILKRILLVLIIFLILGTTLGAETPLPVPTINFGLSNTNNPDDLVILIEIIILISVLSLAPSILLMLTSFTRIAVVMGMLRNALGTRSSPPNQVLVALALFLTFFIMQPTFIKVWDEAIVPYRENTINYEVLFERTGGIFKEFMVRQLKIHHNEDNVDMLIDAVGRPPVKEIADAGLEIIIPAFIVGELEIAFKMGILLYIPFIVIDMVVASVLLAMGMIMIPPVLVSMPFKILIFIVVNGWDLLIGGLIRSF